MQRVHRQIILESVGSGVVQKLSFTEKLKPGNIPTYEIKLIEGNKTTVKTKLGQSELTLFTPTNKFNELFCGTRKFLVQETTFTVLKYKDNLWEETAKFNFTLDQLNFITDCVQKITSDS